MTGTPAGWRQRRTRNADQLSTKDTEIMAQPEPYPDPAPIGQPPPTRRSPLAESRGHGNGPWDRARKVRVICTIINVVCGLFAAVLVAWIIMTIGSANPANGVASFVRSWADGVSLGFSNLFVPANATLRVVLNDGLAAIVWVAFAALVTALIRRLALRGPAEVQRSF